MQKTLYIPGKEELVQLMESIVEEKHEKFRQRLSLVGTQLKSLVVAYGGRDEKLRHVNEKFLLIREEIEQHMIKEENIFFPFIREVVEVDNFEKENDLVLLERPVQAILAEQEGIIQHFEEIRRLTDNYEIDVKHAPTQKICYRELDELEKSMERYFVLERKELTEKIRSVLTQYNLLK